MYGRAAVPPRRQKVAQQKQFAAPTSGWISNRSLAVPQEQGQGAGAAVLDNFFPRSGSVKLRRGRQLYATLEDTTKPVTAMFSYRNGNQEEFFAANENVIYNITSVTSPSGGELVTEDDDLIVTEDGDWFGWSSTEDLDVLDGLTGGDWATVQFATTGDVFLLGVNGVDDGFIYDGTSFIANAGVTFMDSDGTTPTGDTIADMDYIWVYKSRLWYARKDSMNAYYMEDADAVAGNAIIFPLAGIFGLGGSIMFGQNWSLGTSDQGGLGEQNVFVSTQGEVAIYQGSYPGNADDWSKVGVYRIGTPLGKRAFLRGGGDLAIATSVGLVPLSKAIELDITSLNIATVSYPIADAWDTATSLRGLSAWQCQLWPEQKMAVISPPDLIGSTAPVLFISNTETGAWCRYTGWYALCMEVFKGQLYFGTINGEIYTANVSGLDAGGAYTGVCIPLHVDLGSPGALKIGNIARAITRANATVNGQISIVYDFSDATPAAPNATAVVGGNLWGTGIWGQSVWGQGLPTVINQCWASAGGSGYTLAPCYQVTSGAIAPIDDEVISMQVNWVTGELVS